MQKRATAQGIKLQVDETIKTWTSSPEGQKSIMDALSHAAKTNDQLQAARMVDPNRLRIPLNL